MSLYVSALYVIYHAHYSFGPLVILIDFECGHPCIVYFISYAKLLNNWMPRTTCIMRLYVWVSVSKSNGV